MGGARGGLLEELIEAVRLQESTVQLLLDNVARLHKRVVELEKHPHNGENEAPCWDCGKEDIDPIHNVRKGAAHE